MPHGASRRNAKVVGPDGKLRPIQDRYQDLISGDLSVEDLDDEELIQGKLFSKNGTFAGRNPRMIPRAMHVAVVKELIKRSERKLLEDLDDSYQALRDVRDNPRAQAAARVASSIYLIERVSGKIPDKQEQEITIRKFEELAAEGGIVIDIPEEDIQDAVIVEESPVKAIEPPKKRGGRNAKK